MNGHDADCSALANQPFGDSPPKPTRSPRDNRNLAAQARRLQLLFFLFEHGYTV